MTSGISWRHLYCNAFSLLISVGSYIEQTRPVFASAGRVYIAVTTCAS